MASPSSPPRSRSPRTAEQLADEIIAKKLVPTDVYDWKPVMMALLERRLQIDLQPDPTGRDPEDVLLNGKAAASDNIKPRRQSDPIPRPVKKDSEGSWDYVWYVPGWTDPEFDPQVELVPIDYIRRRRPNRDVLSITRPALLPRDIVRNPTPYAKRWGIYPDRTDGRSRLSPSASTTRSMAAAMREQIDQLDAETTRQLLHQTVQAAAARWIPYCQPGSIAPAVFEAYKLANGIPTFAEIYSTASRQNMPFEKYIAGLAPGVQNAYRSVIQEILDDENYQRLVFRDLTADELIRQNIHTMSEAETSDLVAEPLYYLFERDFWEDTTYRGGQPEFPRFVYQLQNQRREWDVHRNPELWQALQPALQMASRVLKSGPAVWEAIRDLRTRQKMDPEFDFRSEDAKKESNATHLTKMVPVEDIDITQCWEPIQSLDMKGFDFVAAIDSILRDHFEIGLGSGRIEPDTGEKCDWIYGCCDLVGTGSDSKIHIKVSSELIWPLLIPDYSNSERLSASMLIAATILHELMTKKATFQHAAQKAMFILTGTPGVYPPGISGDIVEDLQNIGDISYDYEFDNGEPYWNNDAAVELGFAFERDMFGGTLMSMNETEWGVGSEFIQGLPLAVFSGTFPMPNSDNILRGRKIPVDAYDRGIPISFYHRFFTQRFWDEEVPKWGHTIFRQMPPDRTYFALMNPRVMARVPWTRLLGDENYRFVKCVLKLLSEQSLGILSEYCRASLFEARGYVVLREHWTLEIKGWENNNPIDVACRELDDAIKLGEALQAAVTNEDQSAAFANWKASHPQDYVDYPNETAQEWNQRVYNEWIENFRQGGTLLRKAMDLHGLLQAEISHRQRWVFEFLNVSVQNRSFLFRPETADDPLSTLIRDRLDYYSFWASYIGRTIRAIASQPEFATDAVHWIEWGVRFSGIQDALANLSNLIKQERSIDDATAKEIRERFATVPSSLWKSRVQRLKQLAMKEYLLLDPRIRDVLDEFNNRISRFAADTIFPRPPADMDTADQFERIMNVGRSNTRKLNERRKSSIFLGTRTKRGRSIVASAMHRVDARIGKSKTGAAPARNVWNPGAALGSKPPPRDAEPSAREASANVTVGDVRFTVPAKFKSFLDLTVNLTTARSTTFPDPFAGRTIVTDDLVGVTPASATRGGKNPSFLGYRDPAAGMEIDDDNSFLIL